MSEACRQVYHAFPSLYSKGHLKPGATRGNRTMLMHHANILYASEACVCVLVDVVFLTEHTCEACSELQYS